MNSGSFHPASSGDQTRSFKETDIDDLTFVDTAEILMSKEQVEDAWHLCQRGVSAHPYYSTGHLLLGRINISRAEWEEARFALERAFQLEGSSPELLEMLVKCYDELGLADLAHDCHALGCDLDLRPLTGKEDEEGPDMVEENAENRESKNEDIQDPEESLNNIIHELDEMGSPEEALKELEALLEGTVPDGAGEYAGISEDKLYGRRSEDRETEDIITEETIEPDPGEITSLDEVEKEIKSIVDDEDVIVGPVELSEQTLKDISDGLELDDGYDFESALHSLEEGLEFGSDSEPKAGEPDLGAGEESAIVTEDIILESMADDDIDSISEAMDEILEGRPATDIVQKSHNGKVSQAETPYSIIKDTEDSIRVAIQAEIVAAMGNREEAIKLFEALLQWEPDRVSYKERLDELRRIQ